MNDSLTMSTSISEAFTQVGSTPGYTTTLREHVAQSIYENYDVDTANLIEISDVSSDGYSDDAIDMPKIAIVEVADDSIPDGVTTTNFIFNEAHNTMLHINDGTVELPIKGNTLAAKLPHDTQEEL